jgi:dATP/dGTP diphosphohydrolase
MPEVRVTSATGGEKGQKDARLGGADPLALEALALVYGFGEQKYARWNYLKGYNWSLSIDALYRHFLAFQRGEELDPESGLPHMAHVAWHALALVSFSKRRLGTDDRAPREGGALPREMCACHVPGIPVGDEHVQFVTAMAAADIRVCSNCYHTQPDHSLYCTYFGDAPGEYPTINEGDVP